MVDKAKKDYSEPQLTPTEIELVRLGAHVTRYDPNDPRSKVKEMAKMVAVIFGNPVPSDEELDKLIDEIESQNN